MLLRKYLTNHFILAYNNLMEEKLLYDVVIVGGGTAGCACAYVAAKKNLKVLLVEKNSFLGGLMTGGLVVPVMKSGVDELNCNYYNELVLRAKKFHAQITYKDGNDGWFNPEVLKIVLEDLLNFDNLDILFETDVCAVFKNESLIQSVILNSSMLSIPIEAKYYVDATGSAQFSILSGCDLLQDNELKQQNSLRFILGNVDIEKFCKFIKSIDNDENITNTYRNDSYTNNELHFTTASTWDNNKIWALDKYLREGVKRGILKDSDRSYFQLFSVAGAVGEVAFNCPRINNYKNNPFMSSRELIEARKAIWRLYTFAKEILPGFSDSIITNIAQITGIREENRVKTKYVFTKDDLISSKRFKNPVLRANYSIDIHSDKKNTSVLQKTGVYELPLESLISCNFDNLFVIGKIIGADFFAQSALRVQKSCMSEGEAVAEYIVKLCKN